VNTGPGLEAARALGQTGTTRSDRAAGEENFMRRTRNALVVGLLALASPIALQAQPASTKSVAASCEVGLATSLKTSPDGTAIGTWGSTRLYGNGAAWIKTSIELTRSRSGQVSVSKAQFRIFHPAAKAAGDWGPTRLTLGNGKSLVLGAPTYDRSNPTTPELVVDFTGQGSKILSDLASGKYRVQVNHASGEPAFEMDDDRSDVGRLREELDRLGWRCGKG
jgi:hypothetical protein